MSELHTRPTSSPLPLTTKWLASYSRATAAATTHAHQGMLHGCENHTRQDRIASNMNFRDQLKKSCVSPPKGVILLGHHSHKIQLQWKPYWYKRCWSAKKGIYFQSWALEGIPHVLDSVSCLFQYITEIVLLHWNTVIREEGPGSSPYSLHTCYYHTAALKSTVSCAVETAYHFPYGKKKPCLFLIDDGNTVIFSTSQAWNHYWTNLH